MSSNIKQDNWEPCPRCGSNRVIVIPKWGLFAFFLISGLLFTFAGILIWIIFPVGLGLLFISIITLFIPKNNTCRDCNNVWKQK